MEHTAHGNTIRSAHSWLEHGQQMTPCLHHPPPFGWLSGQVRRRRRDDDKPGGQAPYHLQLVMVDPFDPSWRLDSATPIGACSCSLRLVAGGLREWTGIFASAVKWAANHCAVPHARPAVRPEAHQSPDERARPACFLKKIMCSRRCTGIFKKIK